MISRVPSWGVQPVPMSNTNVQFPFRRVGFLIICTCLIISPVKLLTTNSSTLNNSKTKNNKIL